MEWGVYINHLNIIFYHLFLLFSPFISLLFMDLKHILNKCNTYIDFTYVRREKLKIKISDEDEIKGNDERERERNCRVARKTTTENPKPFLLSLNF